VNGPRLKRGGEAKQIAKPRSNTPQRSFSGGPVRSLGSPIEESSDLASVRRRTFRSDEDAERRRGWNQSRPHRPHDCLVALVEGVTAVVRRRSVRWSSSRRWFAVQRRRRGFDTCRQSAARRQRPGLKGDGPGRVPLLTTAFVSGEALILDFPG